MNINAKMAGPTRGESFMTFTRQGTDPEILEQTLSCLAEAIQRRGERPYCTHYLKESDYDEFQPIEFTDFMDNAFRHISGAQNLFCLVSSPVFGDGTLLELGCARGAGVPIVMVSRCNSQNDNQSTSVGDSLQSMADYVVKYETLDELRNGIATLPATLLLRDRKPVVSAERSRQSEKIWRHYVRAVKNRDVKSVML